MIVPDWLAFWGVVAYAIWMALAIIWASVLLSVWRSSRHAIWLLAVVACVLTAARFGLLTVSLGPLVLVARREAQITAWVIDIISAGFAATFTAAYLWILYRWYPPRRQEDRPGRSLPGKR